MTPDACALLDLLPEPHLVVDGEGRILAANPAAAVQWRTPADALVGRSLAGLAETSSAGPPLSQYLERCAGSNQPIAIDLLLRQSNGEPVESRATGRAYPVASGMAVLLRLMSKAETSDFLATLAHELRNPLAPIRNALEVMRMSAGDQAVIAAARSMIDRQLKYLVRLIDDLMDVSRITRGRLTLERERVDIATVLRLAGDASRALLESKQHHFQIEPAAKPLYVEADSARLVQVFSNLLNNSAKYSAPGGTIRVSSEARARELIVTVEDRGVGIPAQMLDRVFDMFVRVDRSASGPHEGLGIGLTLVKRLVELHGGSVEAHSSGVGQGSTFRVRLPLAQSPPEAAPAPPSRERAQPARMRILVADDNRDSAQSLAFMLELEGHDVRTAHDGLEAVEIAEAFRPQVILLDIGMPRLDGYAAARELRAKPWGRSVCLVALTGWGQDEDRRKASDAGFDRHLVKPVDPDILHALIGPALQS